MKQYLGLICTPYIRVLFLDLIAYKLFNNKLSQLQIKQIKFILKMRADQVEDSFEQDPMLESADNFMDESEVGDDLAERDAMEQHQPVLTTQGYQKEGG